MSRVWICYEVIGNETRENLEALKKMLEETPAFRRVLPSGAFIVLRTEGVTLDLVSQEVDPAQLNLEIPKGEKK